MSRLGIKATFSMAYHPQTDGQIERVNQELEQYLHTFCNNHQDDWVDWLPVAQFMHNLTKHSATERSPFELLYRFNSCFYPELAPDSSFSTVAEYMNTLNDVREETRAALQIAANVMNTQHGDFKKNYEPFHIDQLV